MSSETNKKIPFGSNNENPSVASLYEARKMYIETSIPYITGSYAQAIYLGREGASEYLRNKQDDLTHVFKFPMNDLYRQNALYGYLDLEGNVIAPSESPKNFKKVNTNSSMMDFVADALNDMLSYLKKQLIKGCIQNNSIFSNLIPSQAYFSNNQLYNSNIVLIANKFREFCLNNRNIDSKIKDHIGFNTEYIKFLKKHIKYSPVTKSRTTLYFNFVKFCNGLTVKLDSPIDPGNDTRKFVDFYLDSGFLIFSDSCRRFGFVFDKNNPFILSADLNSPAMKKYLTRYAIAGVEDLFAKRYNKVYLEDLDELKRFFYTSYKIFLVDNETYVDDFVCENIDNIIERPQIDEDNYFNDFPDTYWLRLYVYFKNYETLSNFSQQEFENIVKSSSQHIKFGNNKKALDFVNARFDELKGVLYYDTLHKDKDVVQLTDDDAAGRIPPPEIIF